MEARTIQIGVEGMTCEHCASVVERKLLQTEGVTSAIVDLKQHRATVGYNADVTDPQTLIAAIEDAGYQAESLEAAEAL